MQNFNDAFKLTYVEALVGVSGGQQQLCDLASDAQQHAMHILHREAPHQVKVWEVHGG